MTLDILVGIDRDGTIIEDSGSFPGSKERPKEKFVLRPGVIEGIRLLRSFSDKNVRIGLAMISNQSGPARLKVNPEEIPGINDYLNDVLLRPEDAHLDDLQYCDHVPPDYAKKKEAEGKKIDRSFVRKCKDYKPGTGMLEKAARKLFGNPLKRCQVYMIGDRPVDVETGIKAEGRSIFVQSNVEEHSDLKKVEKIKASKGSRGAYYVSISETFYHATKIIIDDLVQRLYS